MNKIYTFYIVLFVFVVGVQVAHAQNNYSVRGTIQDASTGETLPGASIIIKNTTRGTISNIYGYFEIDGIKKKNIQLLVSFVSYETQIIPVSFDSHLQKNIHIKLKPTATNLEGIEVKGQSEGQVKAMLDQKRAVNIKNIVSHEQIVEFPDLNAAEVLQRIPGITVQRDQGEGRYVQLRGTPPEYTNFNINGEQIPSPEGGVRYVGLDIIAADQIEFIEVTKVLTPDMDADGIAGNVNIITKTARDTIPELNASISGGYNNLMETNNYQLQFTFGQRHKKLGFQMNASYYVNNQGSHNIEFDYTRGPLLGQAQDTTPGALNYHVLYKDIELRHYTIQRKRIGASANLDYKFDDKNVIYFRFMYNQFSDDETRRRIGYMLSDANTLTIYREAGIDRDIKDRIKIQEIASINIGGRNQLNWGPKIDYEFAYALATENQPDQMYAKFDNGGITMEIDKTDPDWPVVRYPYENDSIDAFTYGNYEFDELLFVESMVKNNNYTAKLNIEIPYQMVRGNTRYFKFGGKIRLKDKTRDNRAQGFHKYFRDMDIYSQTGPPLGLQTIVDDFNETDLINHGYIIDYMIGPDEMRDFYEMHPQHFKFDEVETWEETFAEDYYAKEDIYAAYAMVRHDIRNFMILGGLRFEQTNINNQGIKAGIDYANGGILYQYETYDERIHRFLLPQVQMRYALNPRTNIRAAATYSYSRANFDDVIPYRQDDDEDISVGNPDLKYPISLNIDFLAERYLKNNGILSGGFFYKKIDNIAFKFTRNAHEGENFNLYSLKKITMAVNGLEAFVYGVEILTQFKMNFLPGVWKNLGIYGNYTFTESDAHISKRYPQNENDVIFIFNEDAADYFTSSEDKEVIPLPGQAKHTFNIALFYDAKKYYIKLSSNYHSAFLDELGNDAGLDVYYDEAFRLDFTANYQLSNIVNIFVDVMNITNTPLKYYMGSRDYFKQKEYYSWWGRFGVKFNI